MKRPPRPEIEFELGDIVRTPTGRLATVVRFSYDRVECQYDSRPSWQVGDRTTASFSGCDVVVLQARLLELIKRAK